jgi:hypothetical protein
MCPKIDSENVKSMSGEESAHIAKVTCSCHKGGWQNSLEEKLRPSCKSKTRAESSSRSKEWNRERKIGRQRTREETIMSWVEHAIAGPD